MAGLLEKLIGHLLGGRRKPRPGPPPGPTPAPSPTPSPSPIPTSTRDQELDSHNRYRAQSGLLPLTINSLLQAAAQSHSDTMARNRKMSHDDAGDGKMGQRVAASGYHYLRIGENVAMGQLNVASVMSAWMNSAGHKANILGQFSECGLAVAYDVNRTAYWCAIFGLPARAGQFAISGTFAEESGAPTVSYGRGTAASSVAIDRVSY